MLEEAELGLAGEKTAIGDAIGLAVKRMLELSEEEKVLVLLTDGRNTQEASNHVKLQTLPQKQDENSLNRRRCR